MLSYLATLRSLLSWDRSLLQMLEQMRVLMVPLLNPVGMALKLRSNGRGVDLMRNAPVQAEQPSRWFELYRGQPWTPYLPWYQGEPGRLEVEAKALSGFIEQELFASECAVVVDVHSGFLAGDRIWFPYARTQTPSTIRLTAISGTTCTTGSWLRPARSADTCSCR